MLTVTNKKKVVHIITGLNDGGAEASLFRLVTNDLSCIHLVVSLGDRGKYGERLERHSISVMCLDMPRGRITLEGICRLWTILKRENPDVIQTWMYHADLFGGVIGKLAGHKNIVWNIRHSQLLRGANSQKTIFISRICAIISRFIPRKIICNSNVGRKVHLGYGYYNRRMVIIQNGLDPKFFCPNQRMRDRVRTNWGFSKYETVIGVVARNNIQKDHKSLLKALMILQRKGVSPYCVLVGSGMTIQNEVLVNQIAMNGLQHQILLLGQIENMPEVMNAIDIKVLSSSFGEGFPNVLAEAMACKTPCVSTDVGDAKEILGDNGIIVPPSNPHDLAIGIERMIHKKDNHLWSQVCDEARRHIVENFSINTMIKKYHDVWFG